MSFSSDIKEEILKVSSSARHCQMAEFSALREFCVLPDGFAKNTQQKESAAGENALANKKYAYLYRKLYNNAKETEGMQNTASLSLLVKNSCCKRAFLRGSFLAIGSMSDPNKGYHLELVCNHERQAAFVSSLLHDFDLDAKIVQRKRYHVVYLKEGENIADFLNVIEAHKALLAFENTRVIKDMRNLINRRVNCEAANINKTVSAATRQLDSIRLIQAVRGIDFLPDNLRQMAYVRLENPDMPLAELGTLLDPPVGKSGVNHRLRKLCEIADQLRGE